MHNNHITVLLIEDDPGDIDFLRELLSESTNPSFTLICTNRLSTGLLHLAEGGIDVVLLDLSLPDSQGLETFIKTRAHAPEVPIVALTGWDDKTIAMKTMQEGAQDYLVKGQVNDYVLVSALRYAIERHRLRVELEQHSQALQASEARFRDIIKKNADGIIIVDQNNIMRFVNPAAESIFDRRVEELLGRSFTLPLAMGEATEVEIARRGGEPVIAEMRVVEVEWEGDRAYLTSLRDITNRKRAEEALRQSQKLESLGVLAGGVAHDFNNLLTSILGNAGLALQKLPSESPTRDLIQQIETTTMRAAEFTRQLLAYAGKGKTIVQPLNLSTLVQEMVQLLETIVSKKAIVKYALATPLPLIKGDASQINQVIMNLITNASDALDDKSGVITVTTGTIEVNEAYLSKIALAEEELLEGSYVYLEVSDTGCGMDEETQAKIFDPFFSTKLPGRGLGLAAVRGIVRGHRGTITVESIPSHGTTFRVLFPSTEQPEVAPMSKPRSIPDWRGSGTILVVDDEEDVRVMTKMVLEEYGFHVLTAADGRAGIEAFREHAGEIVLVLLDLTMPHLSGEEVFHEIRRIRADARVILSSGYTEQEVTTLVTEKGFAGFLQKPYRLTELLDMVRVALGV